MAVNCSTNHFDGYFPVFLLTLLISPVVRLRKVPVAVVAVMAIRGDWLGVALRVVARVVVGRHVTGRLHHGLELVCLLWPFSHRTLMHKTIRTKKSKAAKCNY